MKEDGGMYDEEKVRRLRTILAGEDTEMPLGLRSRVEARLAEESRHQGSPRWGTVGLLGVLAFSAASALADPTSSSLAVSAALGGVYAGVGKWLLADQ